MTEINLTPLFSVPLYHVQTEQDFTLEVEASSNIQTTTAIYNNVSVDNNIINNPEFKNCKEVCEYHLSTYAEKIFNCTQEFYILNSWLAHSKPGEKHHRHFHPHSIISGVLYLQCDTNAGDITFLHQSQLKKDFNFAYTFKEYNIFNSENASVGRPKSVP